jgi:hypothetical protein
MYPALARRRGQEARGADTLFLKTAWLPKFVPFKLSFEVVKIEKEGLIVSTGMPPRGARGSPEAHRMHLARKVPFLF